MSHVGCKGVGSGHNKIYVGKNITSVEQMDRNG